MIIARSIVETAAAIWAFKSNLEKAVQAEDLQAIDEIANEYTFHSRWKGWKDPPKEAPSILTLIDKLDRELPDERDPKRIRNHYEFLSEFAHPNWNGTTGLFGDLDTENQAHFSLTEPMRRTIAQIIAGTGMLNVIEHCVDKV